jgi:hypothetical protein
VNLASQVAIKPAQSARWKLVKVLLQWDKGVLLVMFIVMGRWSELRRMFVVHVDVKSRWEEIKDTSGEEGVLLAARRVGEFEFKTHVTIVNGIRKSHLPCNILAAARS